MAKKPAKVDVRAELLEATGIKPKKNESDEDLSARVATYLSDKMDEGDYDNLSKETKKWFEKYCAASEAEEDMPVMPTLEEEGGDDDADEEEEKPKKGKAAAKKANGKAKAKDEDDEDADEEEEKPKKKGAAAKKAAPAKKAAAKKTGKKAKDEDEDEDEKPKKKSGSAQAVFCEIICRNPKLSRDQAVEKLEAKGFQLAEASLKPYYSVVQHVISQLTELGWSKG